MEDTVQKEASNGLFLIYYYYTLDITKGLCLQQRRIDYVHFLLMFLHLFGVSFVLVIFGFITYIFGVIALMGGD